LASVSRSVAWIDFFQPQPQPLHYPSHVRQADRLAEAAKLGLQLAQDDIRLVLNQSAHPLAIDPALNTALRRARGRPCLPLRRRHLERPANTHPKALSQLAQRPFAGSMSFQQLLPQIITVRTRHLQRVRQKMLLAKN